MDRTESFSRGGHPSFSFKNHFNLYGGIQGQFTYAHCSPGMTSLLPENVDEKIGSAIEHLRLVREPGCRVHVTHNPYALANSVEIPQSLTYLGQAVKGRSPGKGFPFLNAQLFSANLACGLETAVLEGQLTTDKQEVSRHDPRTV